MGVEGAVAATPVVEAKEWFPAAYAPEGLPTSNHLKIRNVKLSLAVDSIREGHVAVEMLWISIEPYQRSLISGSKDGLYLDQFNLNEVVKANGIGRVILSRNRNYAKGDIVINPFFPVADYCVVSSDFLRKIVLKDGIEVADYLSGLGVPGFAAWVGIEFLAQPTPESNVFISAAAGAVGTFAGQLAKLKGCRVVGSTGSDEKVKMLKEELGFDDAFNYKKEPDFDAALATFFPNGIDVYFDNVGGEMLEAVLNHVNTRARITLCGMMSQYNKVWKERKGVRNLLNVVGKEVRMEGFMVGTYLDRFGDFANDMESYMKQGKIKSKYKIYHGIDSYLEGLGSLFSSANDGKVLIQVKP